jgi:hypothetical protein
VNDLDLLTCFRAEVPCEAVSPEDEHRFMTVLQSPERPGAAPRRHRFLSWSRLAIIAPLAAGVAAVIVVATLPGQGPAPARGNARTRPPTLTLQLLADRAAAAALAQPPVRPGQWVYMKTEWEETEPSPSIRTQESWQTADYTKIVMPGGVSLGVAASGDDPSAVTYAKVRTLTWDPEKLDAYFAHLDYPNANATPANKEVAAFTHIEMLLQQYVLPPARVAELYHALALIPTVQVRTNATDIAGRVGVGFVLPTTPQSVNLEIILSSTTYQYLAQAAWDKGGPMKRVKVNGITELTGPVGFTEQAILQQVLVSGPGVRP